MTARLASQQRLPESLRRQLRLADSIQLGLVFGLLVALYLSARLAPSPERYVCHEWFRAFGPLLAIPSGVFASIEGVKSIAGKRIGAGGFAPPFLRLGISTGILVLLTMIGLHVRGTFGRCSAQCDAIVTQYGRAGRSSEADATRDALLRRDATFNAVEDKDTSTLRTSFLAAAAHHVHVALHPAEHPESDERPLHLGDISCTGLVPRELARLADFEGEGAMVQPVDEGAVAEACFDSALAWGDCKRLASVARVAPPLSVDQVAAAARWYHGFCSRSVTVVDLRSEGQDGIAAAQRLFDQLASAEGGACPGSNLTAAELKTRGTDMRLQAIRATEEYKRIAATCWIQMANLIRGGTLKQEVDAGSKLARPCVDAGYPVASATCLATEAQNRQKAILAAEDIDDIPSVAEVLPSDGFLRCERATR